MNDSNIKTISCRELYDASLERPIELVDVRSPEEFNQLPAVGARNLPLDTLTPEAICQSGTTSADEPIYFNCAVGGRSAWGGEMMMAAGHANVVNVEGGTQAWYLTGLPSERGSS